MDMDFSQEQRILKKSIRDFLGKECPSSLVRAMRHDERGYPAGLWAKLAELGFMGVMIPEVYGGSAQGFLELMIVLEAMGEACMPGPFFSTVVVGTQALLLYGTREQQEFFLPRIASGELVMSFAQCEPGNWYGSSNIHTKANKRAGRYRISGTKLLVENARTADYILCLARTGRGRGSHAGLTLFIVNRDAPGITCTPLKAFDYGKYYEVLFEDVPVSESDAVGGVGQAARAVEVLEQRAAVAKCAEMIGAMGRVLELTVPYLKQRVQFGRPIGSFQAVQHHCVNMAMDVNSSRFIAYEAAWKISQGLPVAKEAAMAKAWTSDASNRVTRLAHQLHGAISFCDEHDLHLYYRRVKSASMAFGDGEHHLEKVAQAIGL